MLKIAICEDEVDQQKLIEKYLLQINEKISFDIEIFSTGEELIKAYQQQKRFSIIFLDMKLKILDGIQTAKFIRKYDKNVIIIIITKILEYAMFGYHIEAFDFILKPVTKDKIKKSLESALKKLRSMENKIYILETRESMSILYLTDIIYIESDRKKVIVYTQEEKYVNHENITEAEKKLTQEGFIRISRFYLVNMKYVKEIKHNCIKLTNGISLNYSKKLVKEIKEKYINYMISDS